MRGEGQFGWRNASHAKPTTQGRAQNGLGRTDPEKGAGEQEGLFCQRRPRHEGLEPSKQDKRFKGSGLPAAGKFLREVGAAAPCSFFLQSRKSPMRRSRHRRGGRMHQKSLGTAASQRSSLPAQFWQSRDNANSHVDVSLPFTSNRKLTFRLLESRDRK